MCWTIAHACRHCSGSTTYCPCRCRTPSRHVIAIDELSSIASRTRTDLPSAGSCRHRLQPGYSSKQASMVGTIRRAFNLTGDSNTQSNQSAQPGAAGAPPSYQAATAPGAAPARSGGSVPASAFQRQSSTGSSNAAGRPYSVASPQTQTGGAGRPLSQASMQQRPVSYAQPSGAPPGHKLQQQQQPPQQQTFQQPPPSGPSSSSTGAAGSLSRSNTQEDRMAVCECLVQASTAWALACI